MPCRFAVSLRISTPSSGSATLPESASCLEGLPDRHPRRLHGPPTSFWWCLSGIAWGTTFPLAWPHCRRKAVLKVPPNQIARNRLCIAVHEQRRSSAMLPHGSPALRPPPSHRQHHPTTLGLVLPTADAATTASGRGCGHGRTVPAPSATALAAAPPPQ